MWAGAWRKGLRFGLRMLLPLLNKKYKNLKTANINSFGKNYLSVLAKIL
jgi:hypothetical protein